MTQTHRQSRSNFSRGRGVFACESCGRQTRGTEECLDAKCCGDCYELAGYENMMSDNGPERFSDGEYRQVEHHLANITAKGGDAKRAADDWSGLYSALAAWKAKQAPAATTEAPAAAPAPAPKGGTLLNLCYNARGDVTLYVNGKKALRGTEQEAKNMGNGYGDGRWGVVYDNRK